MNELKFNSAICTSIEQSQRLFELGLKPETADMSYYKGEPSLEPYEEMESPYDNMVLPAWSLHRLLCICAEPYLSMNLNVKNNNLYDYLIDIVERLIKTNKINKKYLKQ